jgi:hypothetical protein
MAGINDLVLVHVENRPGFYARIEDVTPDVKPGWWQVKLLVLTFPLQVYTWILDDSQLNGASFTMGGTPITLERVESPLPPADDAGGDGPETGGPGKPRPKVVSLVERMKDKERGP